MNLTEQILFIDDDATFNETYTEVLQGEGYHVTPALTAAEALQQLEVRTFDLILLDRKLTGGHGGLDTGLDLIGKLRRLAPAAKIVLITGYADAASVQRAFSEGVYEYLEKSGTFRAMLLIKVRNALEGARERRYASLANGKREAELQALWQSVQTEKDAKQKGRLLEELMLILLKSIPGFERTETNQRSADEEFDLVVPNDATDPLWSKESQYFLVECKNWSKKSEPSVVDSFRQKMERRHGRCSLGFFVAIAGFTKGVKSILLADRKESHVVVLLQKAELQQLVDAGSGIKRNEVLRELHQKAIVKG